MDSLVLWATLVAALAISGVALVFVVRPLLEPGPAAVVLDDDRLTELLARKDAALTAIKDLEFDYRVGKIEEEDYQRLDQRLRRQAIALIQQIEKLAPESATLDERLEAEIARLRRTQDRVAPQAAPAAAVVAPAAAPPRPARFCTNCGAPLEPNHKFCAQCGAPVAGPVAVAAADSTTL
jgi:hypothetical protein